MNFLTVGHRLNKQMDKLAKELCNPNSAETKQLAKDIVFSQYRRDVETGLDAYEMFQEALAARGRTSTNWYFITIRPPDDYDWSDFLQRVRRLLARSCFKDWTLSFEQKGLTEDTLGTGYHIHLVADMTQKSKGQVLRDVSSTFNTIKPEFIDVKTTRNPGELISNYLIDYSSDDGHKETTKIWDKMWRDKIGLRDLYKHGEDMP